MYSRAGHPALWPCLTLPPSVHPFLPSASHSLFTHTRFHIFIQLSHRAEVDADEDLSKLTATSILERRSKPFLTLIALMAILDPPRDEAIEAVKVAHRAGITVKMITGACGRWLARVGQLGAQFCCCGQHVGPSAQMAAAGQTHGCQLPAAGAGAWPALWLLNGADVLLWCCACSGDHALTGLAIGKMLGIAGNGSVVTGPELDAMSDEQLKLVSLLPSGSV